MATPINDPVFGLLTWDVLWEGEATVNWLGGLCRLLVETDDETQLPSDDQRRAFEWLVSSPVDIRETTTSVLVEYYTKVRPIYLETPHLLQGGVDVAMPELTSPRDIWSLLSEPTVCLPIPRDMRPSRISVEWCCTWDEHGVQVFYENHKPIYVDLNGHWSEWD